MQNKNSYLQWPDEKGYFGKFGGRYVAETLMPLILEVEKEVNSLNQPTIESKKIGEIVINKLRTLDDVAYISFASVYKDFKDLSNFENELNQ